MEPSVPFEAHEERQQRACCLLDACDIERKDMGMPLDDAQQLHAHKRVLNGVLLRRTSHAPYIVLPPRKMAT